MTHSLSAPHPPSRYKDNPHRVSVRVRGLRSAAKNDLHLRRRIIFHPGNARKPGCGLLIGRDVACEAERECIRSMWDGLCCGEVVAKGGPQSACNKIGNNNLMISLSLIRKSGGRKLFAFTSLHKIAVFYVSAWAAPYRPLPASLLIRNPSAHPLPHPALTPAIGTTTAAISRRPDDLPRYAALPAPRSRMFSHAAMVQHNDT